MTDDIVTRLRAWAEWGDNKRSTSPIKNPFTDSWATVSLEAADEIERLRNDVKVRDLQILANFKAMDAMHKELYGDAD